MGKQKNFRVVRRRWWTQPEVQDYSVEKKLLWIYLLTGTNANQLGIYPFMPRYAHLETGLSIDQIETIMSEFEADGLLIYSRKTQEVAIFDFMETQIVKGGKSVIDCLNRDLGNVQDLSLLDAVIQYNLKHWDDLTDTAQKFITSINHSDSSSNKEESTDDEELMSNEICRMSNEVCLMNNTADNTVDNTSTNTVTTSNISTETKKHSADSERSVIPSLPDVTKYIKDYYYTDDATATATADAFIMYNEKDNWSFAKRSPWTKMLIGFLARDKHHRFDAEAVELRKAEVEKKTEEERKRKEQYDMFRHNRAYIHSAKDLIDYIKENLFFEYDYDLGSCLFNMLYISKTLTEQDIADLYDEKIFDFDDIDGFVKLSDYGIEHTTNQRVKSIAERIKTDVWSGKYKPQTETEKPVIDTTNYYDEELPFDDSWQT